MNYLKLIRFPNLILIGLMMALVRFVFLKTQNIPLALTDFEFIYLDLAMVFLAAGGYVINNIFDQKTDFVNKPNQVIVGKKISENSAYNLYFILTIIGVLLGFYLSNLISKPGFASLFILIAASLYLYSSSFKQMILIGNIVVAALLAFSVVIIGVFDIYPVTNPENQYQMAAVFSSLMYFALYAFLLNFIREIVKDLEDIKGDQVEGMNTLAIYFGIQKTTKIVFALSLILIFMIFKDIHSFVIPKNLMLTFGYVLFFILAPMIYFSIKIWNAKTTAEFQHLSLVLKLIIVFGILSILIFNYNLQHA